MKFLLSMRAMVVMMLIFAFSIGAATFIENDFGIQTARAMVYSAFWFDVLLLFLIINLIRNIIRFKMYESKKFFIFLFHASFILMLIGAAITRYVGYEGTMHIREGDTANSMLSAKTSIRVNIEAKEKKYSYSEDILLSILTNNSFNRDIEVDEDEVNVELKEYLPNAQWEVQKSDDGVPMITMVFATTSEPQTLQLSEGEFFDTGSLVIDMGSGREFKKPVLKLFSIDGKLYASHEEPITYMLMKDRSEGEIEPSSKSEFNERVLYRVNEATIVVRSFLPKAKKVLVGKRLLNQSASAAFKDALIFNVTYKNESREVTVFGKSGRSMKPKLVEFADLKVSIGYGSEVITLPFALKLIDFQLERYAGSNSPSSYASEVVLIDKENGINKPFRIFMNNVLDHRNFRFFQSSYDQDEMGTILSVNHDPGTLPTYIAYFMLGVGLFLSLLRKGGRFRVLMRGAREYHAKKEALIKSVAVALLALIPMSELRASELDPTIKTILSIQKEHSDKFSKLLVQSIDGRVKPINTLNSEIVTKIYGKNSILGLNQNQIILGMMIRPAQWRSIKIVKIKNKKLNEIIGVDGSEKYAAFEQFFLNPSKLEGYKLQDYVAEAMQKSPAQRGKLDKEIIKIDEKINIIYMVFSGSLFNIYPKQNDLNFKWYPTIEALQGFPAHEAEEVRQLAVEYFSSTDEAFSSGDWSRADRALSAIDAYQREHGSAVYPNQTEIDMEILYYKIAIFEKLIPYFLVLGFILLVLAFVNILQPKFRLWFFMKTGMGLLVIFFLLFTAGLILRWYISGHAPWSNGYESMLYIGWSTLLAGFIFSKNSPLTMAATSVLTGLILFVAHLNWLDPQITNLVPVLKSYWLTIHVSMITASYGFLGLGALLGFITLLLFIFSSSKNRQMVMLSIKELNAINEMSLIVGLVLLTVGNFLGGVWANESWGRYWGWDAKETWALVTILVYAVVIHIRFIRGLFTQYNFALISLLSFSSVIMTYFGVNYYLSGLHSYAAGDPVPVPTFVYYVIAVIAVVAVAAFRKRNLAIS